MKRIAAILLILALLCGFAACGAAESAAPAAAETPSAPAAEETTAAQPAAQPGNEPAAEPEKSEAASVYPFTYTDVLGNTITLEKKPERVAVLFSSYAEIWTLTGGTVEITVGDSIKRGFVPEGAVLVNDGAGLKIDAELLMASEPDFVIATADFSAQADAVKTMNEIGVPAIALREENMEDYLSILSLFAALNENPELTETYGTAVAREIEAIVEAAKSLQPDEPVKYLFIRAGAAFNATKAKTAEDHFACVILDSLGAVNIADGVGSLADELSLEAIVERDPDIIILAAQGNEEASKAYITELFASEGWNAVRAVRENNWTYVSKELFNYKPNQRWAEAYRVMSELLYGE